MKPNTPSESKDSENTSDSSRDGWILRIVRSFSFKFWVSITGIATLLIAFFLCVKWVIAGVTDEAKNWIGKIEDPTERGCAYISLSILVFTLVVAIKSFTTDEIKLKK